MLGKFVQPNTVTCLLCRGCVSVRKGDKARFRNHMSHDHEVHFDMELLFALSFMTQAQKDTIVSMMGKKVSANQEDDLDEPEKEESVVLNSEMARIENNLVDTDFGNKNHTVEVSPPDQTESNVETLASDKTAEIGNYTFTNCPQCSKKIQKKYLNYHIKRKHKGKNENIVTKGKNENIITKKVGKYIECDICRKVMQKKSKWKHMKLVHKTSSNYVNTVSAVSDTMKDQVKADDTKENVLSQNLKGPQMRYRKCKLCFKKIRVDNFEKHLKSHSIGVEKCKLCYQKLKKNNLPRHIDSIHKDEKHLLTEEMSSIECSFNCEECPLNFITRNSVDYHIKVKHGRGNEQCEHCKKRFLDSTKLKMHIGKVHPKNTTDAMNIETTICIKSELLDIIE
eukprot:GFUD01043369.1.p1 GENE.GFUD01043369.1~~GFUD01043369.1.p1  ORF type:complete len:395 (-),score=87.50 GFUD01043369.1:29-1213(-)